MSKTLVVVAILALAAASFFFSQNQQYQGKALGPYAPTSTPTLVPGNETDNWNEAVFSAYNFSLKIPESWEISNDALNGDVIKIVNGKVITNDGRNLLFINKKGDKVNMLTFDMRGGLPNGITINGFSPLFEKIIQTFKYTNLGTTEFDHCGQVSKYSTETWYSSFSQTLIKNNLSATDINDMCVALDKTKAIFLLNSSYCQPPEIYQFQADSRSLSKAKVLGGGRGCLAAPKEFGTRNGYVIPMRGESGDAGCRVEMDYYYNLDDNSVKLREERTYCQNGQSDTRRY